MNEAPVIFERDGPVARITLNRPAVLNALDLATHAALAEAWDTFEHDDELWIAVLSGRGERAFSVGQDLKELAKRLADGAPSSSFGSKNAPGWPRLTERFDLSKPVIARVNGLALGGGFELALACDIIVASDNAQFALPEARLGLIPGAGGVFRLTRQMPYRTAMGYLLTGRRMDAAHALALGLINEVVPSDQLDACIESWLRDMLACAPLSLRAIKQAAATAANLPLAEAFATRYSCEEERRQSRDSREGPLAFVEKRLPQWCGK